MSQRRYLIVQLNINVDIFRYICDICGAGLKRKEHLERHKLGKEVVIAMVLVY